MDDEKVVPASEAPEPFEHTSLDKVLTELGKPEDAAPPAAPPAGEPAKLGAEAAKPAEVKPGEPGAPAAPKPGEPATPSGPFKVGEEAKFKISDVAVKTREEIEKLPYANDATFQAIMKEFEGLAQFQTGMAEALKEGRYVIGDADKMKAVLEDAFDLYDIIALKQSPAGLFDLAAKNYGQEAINQVIASILLYAEEKGITKEMYSDLSKPENKKIFDLAKESRERKATEAQTRTQEQQKAEAQQRTNDYDALEKKIMKLAKDAGFADEQIKNKDGEITGDALDYMTYVIAQIGGDQKQLADIRAGKFAEIERIFTEYNNRMVERQQRWEKALTESKAKREQQLKGAGAPAGGAPPPKEPPKKKVDITNDDERLDAVKAALRD